MPLVTSAPVTTPPVVTPPTPPPIDLAGQRQPLSVTYVDPDGVAWPWSDPASGCVITAVSGIGSPPAALSSTSMPGGGILAQQYGAAQRQIVIGLHAFDDASQDGFLDLIDRLARALWTERAGLPAPGTLIFQRPGGTARQIAVFCTSGPEQTDAESGANGFSISTDYALTFASDLDPLFSDAADTTAVFSAPPVSGGIFPLLPVILSPETTLGSTSIVNEGNSDAYPVWTITGPGTPTITNVTTGRSFGLDVDLDPGEVITVDTRPGRQSVIDGTLADRWADLVRTSPRDLWSLPVGRSDLTMSMVGSGDGSKIQLSYRRRWLRA